MIIHDVEQGSAVWKELRGRHYPASLAPAMMGDGYASRAKEMSEYLGHTTTDITPFLQGLFDAGHEAEELARPIAEAEFLESFAPVVGSKEIEGLPLLASFDGLTGDRRIVWEHKSSNKQFDEIPPLYYWQLEQQLIVSGAEKAVLTVTNRDSNEPRYYEYFSLPERRKALLAGWHKWADDCATFEPVEEVADLSDSVEWQREALKYKGAKDMLSLAKTNEALSRKKLIALAGNHSATGGGLTLSLVVTLGRVDYKSIPELDNVDLDERRGESTTSYRITVEK